MGDIDFALRYPFSSKAKEFLANAEVNDVIVEHALERIKLALKGEWRASAAVHEQQKLEEIASFATARMILAHMKNRYVTARFAVAEAKRANHYLSKDSEKDVGIVAAEFGIAAKSEEGKLQMPVYTFLKFSPRSVDYKISNRKLTNGCIEIKNSEKIRLIEEAVRKHVEKIPLLKDASPIIKDAAEKLTLELPKIEPQRLGVTKVQPNDYPPCIERMILSMKRHENLSHTQRWCLAVYLLSIGMTLEDMVSLYSNLPDFNEKITTYQIEHAKKKGYTMPSCATLQSYGISCCDSKLGNPLNWHKISQREKEEIRKKNPME
jgi:DNA primase large subunit